MMLSIGSDLVELLFNSIAGTENWILGQLWTHLHFKNRLRPQSPFTSGSGCTHRTMRQDCFDEVQPMRVDLTKVDRLNSTSSALVDARNPI